MATLEKTLSSDVEFSRLLAAGANSLAVRKANPSRYWAHRQEGELLGEVPVSRGEYILAKAKTSHSHDRGAQAASKVVVLRSRLSGGGGKPVRPNKESIITSATLDDGEGEPKPCYQPLRAKRPTCATRRRTNAKVTMPTKVR